MKVEVMYMNDSGVYITDKFSATSWQSIYHHILNKYTDIRYIGINGKKFFIDDIGSLAYEEEHGL